MVSLANRYGKTDGTTEPSSTMMAGIIPNKHGREEPFGNNTAAETVGVGDKYGIKR